MSARSNSFDDSFATVGFPSPPRLTPTLRRISLVFSKIFIGRSRIRDKLSQLDESRYLEINHLVGDNVFDPAHCLEQEDDVLDDAVDTILRW